MQDPRTQIPRRQWLSHVLDIHSHQRRVHNPQHQRNDHHRFHSSFRLR